MAHQNLPGDVVCCCFHSHHSRLGSETCRGGHEQPAAVVAVETQIVSPLMSQPRRVVTFMRGGASTILWPTA